MNQQLYLSEKLLCGAQDGRETGSGSQPDADPVPGDQDVEGGRLPLVRREEGRCFITMACCREPTSLAIGSASPTARQDDELQTRRSQPMEKAEFL